MVKSRSGRVADMGPPAQCKARGQLGLVRGQIG